MNRSPPHKIDSFFILYFLSNRVRAHTRTHPPSAPGAGGGSSLCGFLGGHREKAAGREKGIDNWSPAWYFVHIKEYIVSSSLAPLRCVAGGIKGTRWESGAYPVAVFAAARLCAERRPLWAGAHEKAGSRCSCPFARYCPAPTRGVLPLNRSDRAVIKFYTKFWRPGAPCFS